MGLSKEIQAALKPYGYKAQMVSITHLPEIQDAVAKLVKEGLIAKRLSDKWHFYRTPNTELPEAKTIIIAALPQPIVRLTFSWQGKNYPGEVAPTYFAQADEVRAESILKKVLGDAGYTISRARLPLKTLAVRSGLARYGKNNLAYVAGMGSFCRLIAFYTDMPCEGDNWRESAVIPSCKNCQLCREKCVNGSITTERFLIHAENCLGFLHDIDPGKAYWVERQPAWPNALIGCMLCQSVCPVNKPYLNNIKNGPSFSERETSLILSKIPWEQLPPEISRKLEDKEIRDIYPRLAATLPAFMEKQNRAR
jgi:epoxyqueuosine reductase